MILSAEDLTDTQRFSVKVIGPVTSYISTVYFMCRENSDKEECFREILAEAVSRLSMILHLSLFDLYSCDSYKDAKEIMDNFSEFQKCLSEKGYAILVGEAQRRAQDGGVIM